MRRRVLLIAEAANPEWTAVPLIGWSLSRALFDVVDAHLVTQIRNREAIEKLGWREGREFTAIDSEAVASPACRIADALRRSIGTGWTVTTALSAASYYYFEHLLWRRFGTAIRERRFDVVHRITPLGPTIPSLLASRCAAAGIPFVWGPINGGVAWPRQFADLQRREGEWLAGLRRAHRWMPGYRQSRRSAAALIVGSRTTWSEMAGYHDRCVYIPDNGIDTSRFPGRASSHGRSGPLRVAFVGRLVPLKGVDMLVDAAAPLVRAGRVVLDVVGDGPEMGRLKVQLAEAGLAAGCRLHGWIPHQELAARLSDSDVLALPSIREFGGGVVLEAMALGIVPVVVDYGGPAELVTQGSGFRVALGDRPAMVASFREVLGRLAEDPSPLRAMGARAARRVASWFTWEAKAQQVLEVYRWTLGERQRPDFGMPFPDDTFAGDDRTTEHGGSGSTAGVRPLGTALKPDRQEGMA
jgi:glycosyltransferase involved in cell wall biosynthesis